MENETLTVIDNRTNKSYTIPLYKGTVRAIDLRQIKTGPDDFGVMTYDPAFLNTASCQSSITFIDGDRGILRYRGYPIDVLAERCSFLEVAYLILNGELPYCGKCLREFEPDDLIEAFGMDVDVEAVGEPCPVCHGLILPGAGMTARWMRYAGLAAGTACAM